MGGIESERKRESARKRQSFKSSKKHKILKVFDESTNESRMCDDLALIESLIEMHSGPSHCLNSL